MISHSPKSIHHHLTMDPFESMESIDRYVQQLKRKMDRRYMDRIQDRVALILIPRSYALVANDQSMSFAVPGWILCAGGETWEDLYTLKIGNSITLKLDDPFSENAVFVYRDPTNTTGRRLELATKTPNPPKDSLTFLAARAVVKAWDKYDEETQKDICRRTLLHWTKHITNK